MTALLTRAVPWHLECAKTLRMPRNTPPRLAIGESLQPTRIPKHNTVRTGRISRMIAAKIRMVRELRGMTQPVLDDAARVSYGTTSRIESGARGRQISIDLVVAFAAGLKCDLLWLVTGQGRAPFGAEGAQLELDLPRVPSSKHRQKPRKAQPPRQPEPRSPSKAQPAERRSAQPKGGSPARAKGAKPRGRSQA